MRMDIRPMTVEDIGFAVDITDREGWGYTERDFENLLGMEPGEGLIAFDGSRRIGMLNTMDYGKTGWIGNVVTESERRGEGIGTSLVLEAVDRLKGKGVKNVGLYSYMESVDFYKRIGFMESFRVSRFLGKVQRSQARNTMRTSVDDLIAVANLDREFFPGDRSPLLQLALDGAPGSFFRAGDDEIVGYVSGFCSPKACEIGPWVCRSSRPDLAEDLLVDCVSSLESDTVGLAVPNKNETSIRIVRRLGLSLDFEVAALFYKTSESNMNLQGLFGVGSLEMG